jgi:signal transduction histidine kinase
MRRRLLLSYLALTLLVLAALEIPLAIAFSARERERLEAGLLRDAFTMSAFVEDSLEGRQPLDGQALVERYTERTGARAVIIDATGRVQADSDPPVEGERSFADRPEFAEALQQRIATGTRWSETLGAELLYVAVPVSSGGTVHGAVRLSYSTDEITDRAHRYWLLLGAIAAVSLLASAVVGTLLARWVAKPVDELRRAATALGHGQLSARAPTESGPPELRELARAFNATATRLEMLVDAQQQFVANASHQLRTPLTALRLRLEMLEDHVDGDATEDLAGASRELQRLARLVDGLLALARAERESSTSTAEPLAVDAVLNERAEAWEPVAAERGVALRADGAGLSVLATADHLTQILDNLIANALEASPRGSTVHLYAEPGEPGADGTRSITIHVTDEGPGLTVEQRERAFDRFWRASANRGELGGSGLGLAIARQLARADGGDVRLDEAPGGGVDAVIRLPSAPMRR